MVDIPTITICMVAIILSVAILILACKTKINITLNLSLRLNQILPMILTGLGNYQEILDMIKDVLDL